jgi:hypothetical protein
MKIHKLSHNLITNLAYPLNTKMKYIMPNLYPTLRSPFYTIPLPPTPVTHELHVTLNTKTDEVVIPTTIKL